jgi:hypothetical protein
MSASAPERALVAAVVSALRAAPAVSALVARRIWDEPPIGAIAPYVLTQGVQSLPWGGTPPPGQAEGVEMALSLTVVSNFGGAEEARAVVSAIRSALHDAPLSLDGWRLVNLRVAFTDIVRAADGRTTLGLVRLRAVVEG